MEGIGSYEVYNQDYTQDLVYRIEEEDSDIELVDYKDSSSDKYGSSSENSASYIVFYKNDGTASVHNLNTSIIFSQLL